MVSKVYRRRKINYVKFHYGEIKGRYVIYRGENQNIDGIEYLNVEEYLNSLCKEQ